MSCFLIIGKEEFCLPQEIFPEAIRVGSTCTCAPKEEIQESMAP